MIWEQQYKNNLEQYVRLQTDLNVQGNVIPACNIDSSIQGYTFRDLLHIIGQRQCGVDQDISQININEFCLIKVSCSISYRASGFETDPLYAEYTKYKFDEKLYQPIILIHPNILMTTFNTQMDKFLYQVDGMHRVMSALEAGVNTIDAHVVVRRTDVKNFIDASIKYDINTASDECTWFPKYQEIQEVGLQGVRKQNLRYPHFYDMSILKGKTVVDFGGNVGQASLEAWFNGASKTVNYDYQTCAIETGKKIASALGADIVNDTIDFNSPTFETDATKYLNSWDWTIFQAIYRTREINDIESNFDFIVEHTNEGIIFEGNADAVLDSDEFYQSVFKKYNFSKIEKLGLTQHRPGYILHK